MPKVVNVNGIKNKKKCAPLTMYNIAFAKEAGHVLVHGVLCIWLDLRSYMSECLFVSMFCMLCASVRVCLCVGRYSYIGYGQCKLWCFPWSNCITQHKQLPGRLLAVGTRPKRLVALDRLFFFTIICPLPLSPIFLFVPSFFSPITIFIGTLYHFLDNRWLYLFVSCIQILLRMSDFFPKR